MTGWKLRVTKQFFLTFKVNMLRVYCVYADAFYIGEGTINIYYYCRVQIIGPEWNINVV